jgi:hypothetical protein
MRGDHNSERYEFQIPRYIDGHDMSLCNDVRVNYINMSTDGKNKSVGPYKVNDAQVDPDDDSIVVFSWLVSRGATTYAGTLHFLITFRCINDAIVEYSWSTDKFKKIAISDGIDNGESETVEQYIDVLTQWKNEVLNSLGGGTSSGATSGQESIPEYWQSHIDEKISTVNALQDAGGRNAVSFVVMTDLHHYSNLGRRAPTLARKIMDECNIRYALVLGDTQNRGSWTTKELAETEFDAVSRMLKPIEDRMLRTQGNHDGSWGATLNGLTYPYNYTPQEMYNRIYRKSHLLTGVHTDISGTGYYVDDTAAHFRYIVLNTQCNEYALNDDGSAKYNNRTTFRFTQSQYDMVVDALSTMPEDWSVAVFGHVPINNSYSDLFGGSNGDHILMRNLLTAYRNKTVFTGDFAGTAGKDSSYTNRVGMITNNSRVSSSGAIKDSTGGVVTDYIECVPGDVIRIKGLDIISEYLPDGTNSPVIAAYDSDGNCPGVIYPKSRPTAFHVDNGITEYTLFHADADGNEVSGLTETVKIRIGGIPVDGEEIVVTVNEEITESIGSNSYDAVSISVDFTQAKGDFVGYFSGHIHADYVYGFADYGVNIITTRCDAKEENDSTLNAERVVGTTTEQSFDIFTVNTKEHRIYATKIGAGIDRVIEY